jgi:hypothetical protein
MAWPEARPLKPASHEADFWFDEALPEVAIRLNLQLANGQMRVRRLE